jgi:hypothetical protein
MRPGLLAFSIICCFLSGCDFLRLLLPHKVTTPAEALSAMQGCGVSPDSISWRVTEDGAFAFGRKSPDAPPIADRQSYCLLTWAKDNRVEVRFIGWETHKR